VVVVGIRTPSVHRRCCAVAAAAAVAAAGRCRRPEWPPSFSIRIKMFRCHWIVIVIVIVMSTLIKQSCHSHRGGGIGALVVAEQWLLPRPQQRRRRRCNAVSVSVSVSIRAADAIADAIADALANKASATVIGHRGKGRRP